MSKKDKKMSKKDKKMVDSVDDDAVEMVDTDEPENKSKAKKGTLVCTRTIRDGGDSYVVGEEYKGKDKAITKRLLERDAIKKA